MNSYIIKRLAQLVIVLLGVTFLTFFITSLAPSDAAEMKYLSMGTTPTPELLAQTRKDMGLDDPFLLRYVNWLADVLHGDFGISYKFGDSVFEQLGKKLPGTLKLAGGSMLVMLVTAFPLGIISAIKKNRLVDYLIRFFSFMGISMPNFWLALILIYIMAVQLGWFRVVSTNDLKGMVLPVMTLTIPMVSTYVRHIRSAVLEELSQEYIIGARARGLSERRIIICHVIPNAMLTLINLIGLSVGHLLGGAAIVESIFSWRGIGSMVVDAISVRDYPLIQGYVIWMAIIFVTVNLLVDIACHLLDPRIRLKGEG
ncbi:ABC transporter permease [Eubacteriaceae bacterium ES2]|nr:ABC transporter permease [Eubacteriaceae bacterium ES2]